MQSKPRKSGVVTGTLLILLGILLLIAQFVKFEGWIFLTGLGIVFLAAGWLLKNYGFLIPGGILTGLGIGIGVGESGYIPEGPGQAGAIVLGIGFGFVLVWAIGWFVTEERNAWPLIPGGILGVVGGLLLAGSAGLEVLELLGNFWPAILIVIGLVVLVSAFRRPQEVEAPVPEETITVASSEEEPPKPPA